MPNIYTVVTIPKAVKCTFFLTPPCQFMYHRAGSLLLVYGSPNARSRVPMFLQSSVDDHGVLTGRGDSNEFQWFGLSSL